MTAPASTRLATFAVLLVCVLLAAACFAVVIVPLGHWRSGTTTQIQLHHHHGATAVGASGR